MIGKGLHRLAWLMACVILGGGCASPGPSPLTYGVRHVTGVDAAVVIDVATEVLADQGYQIDDVDSAAGVVTTKPVATTASGEPPARLGRLSSRRGLRRLIVVRVVPGADVVNVYCQVAVEEQATEAHRMFSSDAPIADPSGGTPIDRDAATTAEQNTVWRTVDRDKAAERRILEAILERIGTSAP